MTREVISVHEGMAIRELAQVLHRHGVCGAPVVDTSGRVVGVVSSTDIVLHDEALGEGFAVESDFHTHVDTRDDPLLEELTKAKLGERLVRDIMSYDVNAAQTDTPASELASSMYDQRIRRVVILEGDRLAGIVSTRDILLAVAGDHL